MSAVDTLPNGAPYAIGAHFFEALSAEPSFAGVRLLNNPIRASDLLDGNRVVFFEDASDGPGAGDKAVERVYRYNVGVINRTEEARLGSHRDYRAAKRALKSALKRLRSTVQVASHREGEVVFRLENIDVGGGLVLGTFTLAYRDIDVFNV